MKKLFLLLALGISLCANAQLTVIESGKVQVGNVPSEKISSTADFTISKLFERGDGMIISPTFQVKYSTGSIAFGATGSASISGGGTLGSLSLSSNNLIEFNIGNTKQVVRLNPIDNTFTSQYDIKAPSFLTTSDARLKKNVTSLSDSFGKLMDVNAVSYNLASPSSAKASEEATKNSAANTAIKDDRTHFGFIAQEIQKIYPNLVVEDEEGILAIDYTGFIPLLVEAYKDLSDKVKEQEEIIIGLSKQNGPNFMPASVNGLADQKAVLKQNKPNPFNTSTSIECTVPQNVASAFICVYDLQGKQVLKIDIRERGDVVNVIDASSLVPGMYIYSLIANGTEIDSKRMIITD
ncbi:MAG: tail fiber domain-containing protein [Muribaculaceae bacterium]|nr:tail fiber domain-containing protein [Muribaculaceae bacterium]